MRENEAAKLKAIEKSGEIVRKLALDRLDADDSDSNSEDSEIDRRKADKRPTYKRRKISKQDKLG